PASEASDVSIPASGISVPMGPPAMQPLKRGRRRKNFALDMISSFLALVLLIAKNVPSPFTKGSGQFRRRVLHLLTNMIMSLKPILTHLGWQLVRVTIIPKT